MYGGKQRIQFNEGCLKFRTTDILNSTGAVSTNFSCEWFGVLREHLKQSKVAFLQLQNCLNKNNVVIFLELG